MSDLFSPETAMKVGAVYGAAQAVANVVMMLMTEKRNHTILYKICKAIVSGPRRVAPPEPEVGTGG